MALQNYTVKYNQNIFDVALQKYGDISGVGDLLSNNLTLNFGTVLKIGDVLQYDDDNIINDTIVNYLAANSITISNGVGKVYPKETDEELKILTFVNRDIFTFQWEMSGSGAIIIDWGDNTNLQHITLTDESQRIEHNMDSYLASDYDYRQVRMYGDFSLTSFDLKGSNIEKLYAIHSIDIKTINLSGNGELSNIGFFDILTAQVSIDINNMYVDSLLPLISQEQLNDLWINDSLLSQESLDEYFIGLVTGYQDRPICNVRMWGNNSPSGKYQAPEELFNPQTGLEAMWVLENMRGWTIQEIIAPPLENTIISRFQDIDGVFLTDAISEELDGASLKLPVSKFVAFDTNYFITSINMNTVRLIDFSFMVEIGNSGAIISANDDVNGNAMLVELLSDGHIICTYGENSITSDIIYADYLSHIMRIAIEKDGIYIYVDGGQIIRFDTSTISIDAPIVFGCELHGTTKSNHADLLLWDIYINNDEHIMPLPHLGYDTVTGEDYSPLYGGGGGPVEYRLPPIINEITNGGGSKYMLQYGAIKRNTNRIYGGYSEKINDGSTVDMLIENVSGSYLIGKNVRFSGQIKINPDALLAGVQVQLCCIEQDWQYITIAEHILECSNTSYEYQYVDFVVNSRYRNMKIVLRYVPETIIEGNIYAKQISLIDLASEYIPNKIDGDSLYPLLSSDVHISGSNFLNTTPFTISFSDTDLIWNKSNVSVWNSLSYDSLAATDWDMTEFNQSFINKYISDEFKSIPWVKIDGDQYADIFQYLEPLTGDNKDRCDRYVHLTT